MIELIELGELDTARMLLDKTEAFNTMKKIQPERYLKLERMMNALNFDPKEAYQGTTKEKRREQIAKGIFLKRVFLIFQKRLNQKFMLFQALDYSI